MTPATPTPAATRHAGIFAGYQRPAGLSDELLDGQGRPRPHWEPFIQLVETMGPTELGRRWEQAQRVIRENGVTYNVYGDPSGMDRPWELDALPLLHSAESWAATARGLAQRARLLDRILADVYGPQRLLREGLIPREIVFANPAFLRPCHLLNPPGDRYLHLYAADLGRSADGSLCVINDRAQAPSGAGYALENRIVVSRTLPDVFRDARVHRLASFFRTLRQTLAGLAPGQRENPRVVLLTPGPLNETYFEHAYLARYLGYTLAEGSDLTVRDDRLYLKTLGGLQQVDVVLRRTDAEFCDPLELRADSVLGTPGLVQAARRGNVAIANALGSGMIEAAALTPYLPALCRTLLSQELELPSAPTWWCGEEKQRQYVLDHLDRLVVKPAFPSLGSEPVFGDELSQAEREALVARIGARPHAFVAQERLTLSTAPSLAAGGRLEPRHVMVRAYAAADTSSPGPNFAVMPGGLVRVGASAQGRIVSMQRGGGSKDLWVLSRDPVNTYSLLAATIERVELSRGGGDLPSRVADNLFWLGRYAERAEALVRLLRGILTRLPDQAGPEPGQDLLPLMRMARQISFGGAPPAIPEGGTVPKVGGDLLLAGRPEQELLAMLLDEARPGSVRSIIAAARRAAGTVRDRLALDAWRIIVSLEHDLHGRDRPVAGVGEALALLDRLIVHLTALAGLIAESMTRGQGWTFLDMGKRLERAMQISQLIRFTMVLPPRHEGPLLEATLEIADSLMTYRRRYLASLQPHAVLDLLLLDETNPRSAGFAVAALNQHVQDLPGPRSSAAPRAEQRMARAMLATLQAASADDLARVDSASHRHNLEMLLNALAFELPMISESIGHGYLSHTITSRQLGEVAGP
ncbi:MAG: circularly permuted type 2 ATP-grasp protein [Planctomycetota bacterium]|nr:circularly permuted type 2 ATP-grasp protein [Planctomycetota bacterium]